VPEQVLIIATGGTFDKKYHPVKEDMVFDEASIVEQIVEVSHITDAPVVRARLIDSLDMDDSHRAAMVNIIDEHKADRVLIVHGTSTIRETANYLAERFAHDKTIVLTGALIPVRYDPVEGAVNFGLAFGAARYLAPGVYVSLHGLAVAPDKITKQAATGFFRLV